jgi:hypothetical protein
MSQEQEENFEFAYGVEILLKTPDDFLKLRETLQRIGVKSKRENILYQSVHILHKRGRYFLLHFLEFFMLDGKTANFSDDDFRRRNTVAKLVSEWGLCKVKNKEILDMTVPVSELTIVPFKEKKNYQLVSKYTVGGRK